VTLAQISSEKVGRKIKHGDSTGPGPNGKDKTRKQNKGTESGSKKWADGSEDWHKAVSEA